MSEELFARYEFSNCNSFRDVFERIARMAADLSEAERKLSALAPVDAEPVADTARALRECAAAWEQDACLLGNVRAGQVVALCDAVLSHPPRVRAGVSGLRFVDVCTPSGALPHAVSVLRRLAIGGRSLVDEDRNALAWLASRLQWAIDKEAALALADAAKGEG